MKTQLSLVPGEVRLPWLRFSRLVTHILQASGVRFTFREGRFTICAVVMVLSLVFNANALSAASPSFADRVIEHRLANGLTVLMVERHQTPVVSINITFAVGGINEQVGHTGIAHLY